MEVSPRQDRVLLCPLLLVFHLRRRLKKHLEQNLMGFEKNFFSPCTTLKTLIPLPSRQKVTVAFFTKIPSIILCSSSYRRYDATVCHIHIEQPRLLLSFRRPEIHSAMKYLFFYVWYTFERGVFYHDLFMILFVRDEWVFRVLANSENLYSVL